MPITGGDEDMTAIEKTVVGLERVIDDLWKAAGSPTEILPFEERPAP